MKSYVDGIARAALVARTMGAAAAGGGQPEAIGISIAIARAIEAEIDTEPTPPRGTVLCACCGQPLPPR